MATLKHVYQYPDRIRFEPDSWLSDFKPFEYRHEDVENDNPPIQIIGKLVSVSYDFDGKNIKWGNYMPKKCDINGESIGILSPSFRLKDGIICKDCTLKSGYPLLGHENKKDTISRLKNKTVQDIKQTILKINTNKKEIKKNSIYNSAPGRNVFVYFDDVNKIAMFGDFGYYRYSNINSHELYVEVEDRQSTGAVGATVGTLVLPVIGTIIGGLARRGIDKSKFISCGLKITANGNEFTVKTSLDIDKNSKAKKIDSPFSTVNIAIRQAENIDQKLNKIEKVFNDQNPSTISSLDDLTKLKELLDNGIITQSDFDAKKKQILGL